MSVPVHDGDTTRRRIAAIRQGPARCCPRPRNSRTAPLDGAGRPCVHRRGGQRGCHLAPAPWARPLRGGLPFALDTSPTPARIRAVTTWTTGFVQWFRPPLTTGFRRPASCNAEVGRPHSISAASERDISSIDPSYPGDTERHCIACAAQPNAEAKLWAMPMIHSPWRQPRSASGLPRRRGVGHAATRKSARGHGVTPVARRDRPDRAVA